MYDRNRHTTGISRRPADTRLTTGRNLRSRSRFRRRLRFRPTPNNRRRLRIRIRIRKFRRRSRPMHDNRKRRPLGRHVRIDDTLTFDRALIALDIGHASTGGIEKPDIKRLRSIRRARSKRSERRNVTRPRTRGDLSGSTAQPNALTIRERGSARANAKRAVTCVQLFRSWNRTALMPATSGKRVILSLLCPPLVKLVGVPCKERPAEAGEQTRSKSAQKLTRSTATKR